MTNPDRPTISEMLEIKSVAIIGVSTSMGYYWAHSMLQWQHELKVWLVSRNEGEALGHKIYQSVEDIPESIDYAIIRVPYNAVSEVLKQVSKKGAKGATIFTSGFSELGTEEGKQREKELKALAESLPIRVLGPNCMGLMYPKIGFAFMPSVMQRIGNVGFISQSGGVAISTYTAGVESGVGFSKVFSFGNASDVTPTELLEYFQTDAETAAVGAYIEGTKQGKALLNALKGLAEKKPVVVLKGGRSDEGSRVVSSHTGALAGSRNVWDAAFRQSNVPTVKTLEDLIATLSVFSLSPRPKTRNVGIIAISGGTSVVYTDLCIESGLFVPRTSKKTLERLDPMINDVGTSLGNPIDLAANYYDFANIGEVIKTVGEDRGFDSIILEADPHHIHQVGSIMGMLDATEIFWKVMAEACRHIVDHEKKPVLIAIPEVAYAEARMKSWNVFVDEGLPVLRNINEAVVALTKVCSYYETRDRRERQ
ncbi:MAG: CoA-binding protein [Candidatus Thorarchaeota archaeon]|jgi:acyl-CoA synthetase (NDP forming)